MRMMRRMWWMRCRVLVVIVCILKTSLKWFAASGEGDPTGGGPAMHPTGGGTKWSSARLHRWPVRAVACDD